MQDGVLKLASRQRHVPRTFPDPRTKATVSRSVRGVNGHLHECAIIERMTRSVGKCRSHTAAPRDNVDDLTGDRGPVAPTYNSDALEQTLVSGLNRDMR